MPLALLPAHEHEGRKAWWFEDTRCRGRATHRERVAARCAGRRVTAILMDGRYLGPKASGVGRYQRELVSEMQRLRPRLDFRFIVRQSGDQEPLCSSCEIEFDHGVYGAHTSLMLDRELSRAGAVDLFHSPFHVLPRRVDCPAVVTMHDAFNFEQNKTSNYAPPISWAEWAYFLWAIPRSLQRARRVLCVSETTAREIRRRVPQARDKLRVVPHGVSRCFRVLENRSDVEARCREMVGSAEPFLLSIGGVSPNKNHVRMLRAFAAAFPEGSKVRLAVVNRFGDAAPLRALARKLGVSERYVSLGSPADADLVTLLNGAAALAFCSTVEGFGLPILEAMACGCPVLTSTISCMPEVAGEAAVLADPYNIEDMARGMRRMLGEPSLSRELRARGLERAKHFTWERAARSTLEVYDECLKSA
jgi:glycosyltransferase involved in cell wall biosynthesis